MRSRQYMRMGSIVLGLVLLASLIGVSLYVLQESLLFFRTPSQLEQEIIKSEKSFRLGGIVAEKSVRRSGVKTSFVITDFEKSITVEYRGILPALFREGQGIVAEGKMRQGVFIAKSLLAKHDEKYMPRELTEALKETGRWQGNE
ncbi:MAG: cytochrome c maturation protein CcmE [Parvibaculales bacterium]